ncbi:MAG: DUF362 domain-containing protein [Promethearchaeota archaeon]
MKESIVYIYKTSEIDYPTKPPFHPNKAYPEYIFGDISKEKNSVYEAFRNLLKMMKLDEQNFNTETWNPFKEDIKPGDVVLIKPNLVIDSVINQNSITTHPSIIRAIIDYVIIALKEKGEIIVGDAPLQKCNFNYLTEKTGLKEVIDYFKSKNVNIKLIDFRKEKLIYRKKTSLVQSKYKKLSSLEGDPKGYTIINLKEKSNLQEISYNGGYKRFRVTNYDPYLMRSVHNIYNHMYLISNSVIKADVVINVPKIKSHRKAGITACLKNTIGINGHKDWLPHHRKGSIHEGGDEYLSPNTFKKFLVFLNELNDTLLIRNNFLYKIYSHVINFFRAIFYKLASLTDPLGYFEGSWYGNDTIWRTIADLNQILFYANKNGILKDNIQRKILYFCDGIISGESEGPLEPVPNPTGILIGGSNPVMIDLAITEILNFNHEKIPQIMNIFNLKEFKITDKKPSDLMIYSNFDSWNNKSINEIKDYLNFKPTKGWENYIEK